MAKVTVRILKPKRKVIKFRNGQVAKLGQRAWWPWSQDSFSGPHEVKIEGIMLTGSVYIVHLDGERCWVSIDTLQPTKALAEKEKEYYVSPQSFTRSKRRKV